MDLGEYLREQQRRQQEAEALYPKLVQVAKRLRLHRLTYRCRKRCLLLDAIETPEGIVVHQKRFKVSPELNDSTSNEDGRRANTYDGVNHWRARTYFESVSALHFKEDDFGVLTVQCDHTRVNLRPSEFGRDWAANIAEVILPRVVTEHDDAVR